MKKIVITFPHMGLGGAEIALLGFLKTIPWSEAKVTLTLFEAGGELFDQLPSGLDIRFDGSATRAEYLRRSVSSILKRTHMDKLFCAAKSVYHRLGPSIIKANGMEEYDIAIAFCDGLATWHTAKAIKAKKKVAFVHTDVKSAGYAADTESAIYKEYDMIVCGSAQSRSSFIDLLPECAPKTVVLPCYIDASRIEKLSQDDSVHLGDGGVSILTVGRLSHEKGMLKIPYLLMRLRDDGIKAKWYVIGDGVEREKIQGTANKLGVGSMLELLGPKENPYPYIRSCDVYVQPSDYEGFCIALSEALVLKKPCVACDFAGAREQILSGVTGYVTGFEIDDIYKDLKRLLNHLEDFRENAKRRNSTVSGNQKRVYEEWWKRLFNENE